MLSVLIMVHVLVLVQESPPAETLKVVENPNFQAGSRFVFRNGLVGVVGAGQLDAPLSNLPAPDTWIAVARKTTRLRLDPHLKPVRSGSSRPASKSRRAFSLTGGVGRSAPVGRARRPPRCWNGSAYSARPAAGSATASTRTRRTCRQ